MLASRIYNKLAIDLFIILFVAASSTQAKEWRGITPLHSSRADVERLLGPPSTDRSTITFYDFDGEEVSFHYAKGPCAVASGRWNVPTDTVTSIWVMPKPNRLKFSDLKLDESKYKRVTNEHLPYIIQYVNPEEGISYEIDTSDDNMVTLVKFEPTAKDDYLRCPDMEGRLVHTVKFDEYSNISFADEKARLDNLALALQRDPAMGAHIVAYAGRRTSGGEARARLRRAKNYLINAHHVEAGRITTKFGGRSEKVKTSVELYITPVRALTPTS